MSKLSLGRDRYGGESGTFAQEYADKLMAEHKGKDVLDHPDGSVGTNKLANGVITTAKLTDKAVTTAKLNDGAVTTEKMDYQAVTSDKIEDGAVTTVKIYDNAVTAAKIANGSIATSKLGDEAVTSAKIGTESVITNKIAGGAVTNSKIAGGAVTTEKIADEAVTTYKIADGAVTEDKLNETVVKTINDKANEEDVYDLFINPVDHALTFADLSNPDVTVTEGSPIPGQGDSGTALEFTGEDSISIPNYIAAYDNYTIAFKLKTTQAGHGGTWIQGVGILDGDMPGWCSDFGFGIVEGGYLQYGEGEDGQTGLTKIVYTNTPVNDGKWHSFFLTRNNGVASLYMDGVLHNKAECFTTPRSATNAITIGSLHSEPSENRHYIGLIDDILFYEGVAYPLVQLSNVAKTGKAEDLVDWDDVEAAINGKEDKGTNYDYIVNTLEDFTGLISSDTWLDKRRILINNDIIYQVETPITIPTTVNRIDGNGAATLFFATGNAPSVLSGILGFETAPSTMFSMNNLNIAAQLSHSNWCVLENIVNINNCYVNLSLYSNNVYTFGVLEGCSNLFNVYVRATGWESWQFHNTYTVYNQCSNLTNCYGYGDGCDSIRIFSYCNNLNGCSGEVSDSGYSGSSSGYGTSCSVYSGCTNCVNCKGTSKLNDSIGTIMVFSGGSHFSNCSADVNVVATTQTGVKVRGFNSCAGLANCIVSHNATAGTNIGYNSCAYANGCRKGTFTGTLWSGTTTKRDDDSCDLE